MEGFETVTKDATLGDIATSLVLALPPIAGSSPAAKTVERASTPRAPSATKPAKPAKPPTQRPTEEAAPAIIE
jgi:hypothetical protein